MSHAGRLLVATPLIGDPNFERTVVLLLSHDPDVGAFGVVLNRPSEATVAEVLPMWHDVVSPPGVLFIGGPVGRDRLIGLAHQSVAANLGTAVGQQVSPDWWSLDLHEPPPAHPVNDARLRLFAGSAGWARGQLEDEVGEGAWWPVDALVDDVTGPDSDGLWTGVLRRQPGETAWFANHPDDPSAN